MRGTFSPRWAADARGQAIAAPPIRVMNSRRLTPDIGVPPASALPVYRTLNLQQRGRKVLGPDLKCSESDWVEHCASPPKDSTPRPLLRCGISIRPMTANGMVRPCSGPASKRSW